MKKRVFALVLALALCMGLTVPAFAFTTAGRHSTITSNYQYAYIDSNGSLWIWGDNNNGQLGNGQIGESETPVKILDDVISVSTGYGFTGALKSDGSLWMWGENYCGELGNGRKANTVDDMRVPVQTMPIKIMDNVATFSCGAAHAAAVKTDGTLWVWGDNGAYQLGNGGKGNLLEDGWVYQTVPYKLADNVVSVSCGSDFTAFIKSDGSLWGCGTTSLIGVKGAGDYKKPFSGRTYQTVPLKMMDDIKMVSCGHTHMAAIKTDGTLWTWGSNNQGQLGSAVYLLGMYYVEEPQKATIKGDVAFVNAGTDVTAAITTDGTLYMAGSNGAGLLGRGVEDMTSWAFHRVMDDVVSVQCRSIASSGNGNILAVKKDRTLWQWGNNTLVTSEYGRIYRKDALSGSSVPVQTLPLQIPNVTVKVDNLALAGFTVSASTPTIGNFTDVKASDYYADAVLWAVDQKITSGTGGGKFSPAATCTRGQIVTFLHRAMA